MVAAFLAVLVGADGGAAACSCLARASAGRFYAKKEDVLPAGADGVLWQRGDYYQPVLTVERVHRGRLSPVRFSLEPVDSRLSLLRVDRSELKPGRRLRFTARLDSPPQCSRGRSLCAPAIKDEASVEVVVSKTELPRSAKVYLEPSTPGTGEILISAGSACSQKVRAEYRDLRVVLPAELKQFEAQYIYRTLVDGVRWEPTADVCEQPDGGRSWMGPGRERVFAMCELPCLPHDRELDLERGRHSVVIDVFHLASGRRYRAEALDVSFECGWDEAGDKRSRQICPFRW